MYGLLFFAIVLIAALIAVFRHREQIMEYIREGSRGAAADREDEEPQEPDKEYLAGLAARRGILMEYDKGIVREHFVFHGHVQGVGFRYQAMYAARNYGVTGWVENLSDGSVEMEAQGTPEAIAMVLSRIRNARWIRIDEMQVDEMPLQEGERGFGLRGY